MSKVVQYLNQHIRGEAASSTPVLRSFSHDNSVLGVKPQFVIFPKNTNDIRKLARFASQLAAKKHILPITTRGAGMGTTGAALGIGAVAVTAAHMNRVLEFDPKQKQVRVQPGASLHTITQSLALHGQGVKGVESGMTGTVGGYVAEGTSVNGSPRDWIERLEVVLASGDTLQTGRLTRRELSRLIGKTTPEAEIYRQIDTLIEDNKDLVESLETDAPSNFGYSSIARVKQKDGSIDLTPLFVGSQGTLGIISEMILKTDFVSFDRSQAVIAFADEEEARDLIDEVRKLSPSEARYFDGALFDRAAAQGAVYPAYSDMNQKSAVGAVLYVSFRDFSERQRKTKVKKLMKLVEKLDVTTATDETHSASDLESVRRVGVYGVLGDPRDDLAAPLASGFYIPDVQRETFVSELRKFSKQIDTPLPIAMRLTDNIYELQPYLHLSKVGDRQKVLKIVAKITELVETHKGTLFVSGAEGRLYAPFAEKGHDAEVIDLFNKIRTIFDPNRILNPDVKTSAHIKDVVSQLRNDTEVVTGSGKLAGEHV